MLLGKNPSKHKSSDTSIGRGAPKVEYPAFPGENVTLPGSVIP